MPNKKPNAEHVWKQLEDLVVPRLSLSVTDRAVYSHLLRHSRLEGKRRLQFSILWLARNISLSGGPVRDAVRRLAERGILRLIERSKAGHVAEVRLPEEIRGTLSTRRVTREQRAGRSSKAPDDLENADSLQNRALRRAIHLRENGRCFYCLRRITGRMQCLDHVVPRSRFGKNSYRNLASCCLECNSGKGERAAKDFLRRLYREQRLTAVEFTGRLRALDALAAGKLRPVLESSAKPLPVRHRPPFRAIS
jgi:5-methylcytosine-specific restriction endonuclease McrA